MAKVHITEITATERRQVVTLSNGDTLECLDDIVTETDTIHGPMGTRAFGVKFTISGTLVI